MSPTRRCLAVLSLLPLVLLGGCLGGQAAPEITRFSASTDAAVAGESFELVAEFSNGNATIDHGVGSVRSGVPVTVSLQAGTRYMLTVTNAEGVSSQATVDVALMARLAWTFDVDAPGWQLVAGPEAHAEVRGGSLVVDASQYNLGGPCTAASGTLSVSDPALAAGSYAQATFTLDLRYASGTGMGYPAITVTYGGRPYSFKPGDVTDTRFVLRFDTVAGHVTLSRGGTPVETVATRVTGSGTSVLLSADACAADLESEDLALDALAIEAH